MVQKYAVPLTFILSHDQEAKGWASLAPEIGVASCGDSADNARDMLKDAVELWASYEIEEGQGGALARPASAEVLADFLNVPREDLVIEHHTLVLTVETEPQPKVTSLEFVPTAVTPGSLKLSQAA